VGPLSFVSPSLGYGLIEFATTGLSTAQQLVVTDDGGLSWHAATAIALPAWASVLAFTDADDGSGPEAVSPIGASLWAISSAAVLESSRDGGTTWQRATPPPLSRPAIIDRVSLNVAFVLGAQSAASGSSAVAVARTDDGGLSWQAVPIPPGSVGGANSFDLVALSSDDLWLVQFGQPATDMSSKWVYRSYDGGTRWLLMASQSAADQSERTGQIPVMGDFGPMSVLASDPDRAWLAEDRGGLLVTSDGGLDWQPAFADPVADAEGPPTVSFLDAAHGWASTGDGLWRTTDGRSWTEISSPAAG
jgi:photosystem II stability/assembly factor-like uncharacterized protein